MKAKVLAFPGSLGEGLRRSAVLGSMPHPRRILVVGMGGSAIAGDLVRDMWPSSLCGVLEVHRGGPCLGPLSSKDLVVLSSYSGNTRETLDLARQVPASCNKVVLSSGGLLSRRTQRKGWKRVALPPGWPPRAALGYGLGALAGILNCCGLVRTAGSDIRKAARELSRYHQDTGPGSLAYRGRSIAKLLSGSWPLVFGVTGESVAVARRFANQLNENGKVPAVWAELPEAAHNLIVGLQRQKGQKLRAVVFTVQKTREGKLAGAMGRVLRGQGIEVIQVQSPLSDRVQDILWMVAVGDLASVELASLKGVDPTAVVPIDRLKSMLKRGAKAKKREL